MNECCATAQNRLDLLCVRDAAKSLTKLEWEK